MNGELSHQLSPLLTNDRIARRWLEHWSPLCAIESKKDYDPATIFGELRFRHLLRSRRLLSAHIAWTSILRNNLDSPLTLGVEFDRLLCLAIERRRSRLGRKKGEGKKYAQIHRKSS